MMIVEMENIITVQSAFVYLNLKTYQVNVNQDLALAIKQAIVVINSNVLKIFVNRIVGLMKRMESPHVNLVVKKPITRKLVFHM